MTNEAIRDCFNDLYGKWWKRYRGISPVTDAVCEDAYNTGKEILQKYGKDCTLAIDLFVDLLDVLNNRRLEDRGSSG